MTYVPIVPDNRLLEIIRGFMYGQSPDPLMLHTPVAYEDMRSEVHLLQLCRLIVDECQARLPLWGLEAKAAAGLNGQSPCWCKLLEDAEQRITELEKPVENEDARRVFDAYFPQAYKGVIELEKIRPVHLYNAILSLLHRERSRADNAEQRIAELEAQVPKGCRPVKIKDLYVDITQKMARIFDDYENIYSDVKETIDSDGTACTDADHIETRTLYREDYLDQLHTRIKELETAKDNYKYLADQLRNIADRNAVANETLRKRVAELEKELAEEARLNAMGAEREAKLVARVAELEKRFSEHQRNHYST